MATISRNSSTALMLIVTFFLIGLGCSSDRATGHLAANTASELAISAPVAINPWQLATNEQVTRGADLDLLSRRALQIDDLGTIHAIYQRGVSADQGLYYTSRNQAGEWSTPEVVGQPGTYPGTGWLEVRRETGDAYVVFFQSQQLTLGVRQAGGWQFHSLETPPEFDVCKAAMTIDASGRAHIAMLVNWDNPLPWLVWQIAYGYWDGSSDFHFQLLKDSWDPHFGLFSQPDIVVRPDGSVAIAYHHNADGQFLIRVEENNELGGTDWSYEHVDVKGVIVYPESLEIDQFGYLHLGFHTNIELGAEHHVYYACRRDAEFSHPEEVSGDFTGARPRIAFDPGNAPHFVFEETLGPRATGRLIHAYRNRGKWQQQAVVEKEAVTPSFCIDSHGNGSILFERRIVPMENHNIRFFGHAQPTE